MERDGVTHRLAAILSADVVGYSRHMAQAELATVRELTAQRERISRLVAEHAGRVVDAPGDNLLAELPSATDAVACAVAIQRTLAEHPGDLGMQVRIGVHLGDVLVEGDRIYGDGINVAARLEALAEPGGVCMSGVVHDQVRSRLELACEDMGEQSLKNIPTPVRAFRLKPDAAPSAAPESSEPHSVAVLPFANMSGDPEQEYFADGLTEDLITDLSKIAGLLVISRTSAFTYKGRAVKVSDVGRDLGVRYVLEGSVRRSGDRVRITAQLVLAGTGHHVWAERYDREMGDIFALQDEVTASIISALELSLPRAPTRAAAPPTSHLEAYDHYLRGLSYLRRVTRDGNERARREFERALEIDPAFGLVHAAIARSHVNDWVTRGTDDASVMDRAFEHARQAISLDETQAVPHGVLASLYSFSGRHEEAVVEGERAVELDPNDGEVLGYLGNALNMASRYRDAADVLERALRLDPSSDRSLFGLAVSYRHLDRHAEAIELNRRALRANPEWHPAAMNLAALHAELGELDEARAALAELRRIVPDFSMATIPRLPFRNPDDLAWIVRNLRKAGLED